MTSIANCRQERAGAETKKRIDDLHQRTAKKNKSTFENPEVEHEECTKHFEDVHIQHEGQG